MDIAYDFTRLATRLFNVTPNGIDRVDFALAQHFLTEGDNSFGILAMPGPRLHAGERAFAAISMIAAHWGENLKPEDDAGYLQVVSALARRSREEVGVPPLVPQRIKLGRPTRFRRTLELLIHSGLSLGHAPDRYVPKYARYVNASQFPLWIGKYFDWLKRRSDVRAAFFIHDLLPLSMPEYFRTGEFDRHRSRLTNLARVGSGAIVASDYVREELAEAMHKQGRADFPIAALPIPVSPIFSTPRVRDPHLSDRPYFVCCGTIEPRKNHLLLLNVWRSLVQRNASAAPVLVLVGARGWRNRTTVSVLERSEILRNHVVEISGLSTPALKRLLDNACALLMPTFAEGYGLPVREALQVGLPVVASDIPAFREEKNANLRLLHPIDGNGWMSAIEDLSESHPIESNQGSMPAKADSWRDYFSELDSFIEAL